MLSNRITNNAPYGQHITLTCANHPELRWSTKNIDYIGARSLFYLGAEGEPAMNPTTPECPCSIRHLIVLEVEV
jgi:hypothetical protein